MLTEHFQEKSRIFTSEAFAGSSEGTTRLTRKVRVSCSPDTSRRNMLACIPRITPFFGIFVSVAPSQILDRTQAVSRVLPSGNFLRVLYKPSSNSLGSGYLSGGREVMFSPGRPETAFLLTGKSCL